MSCQAVLEPRADANSRESLACDSLFASIRVSSRLLPAALVASVAIGCGGGESPSGSSLDAMAAKLDQKVADDAQAAKEQAAVDARAEVDRLQAEADRLANQSPTQVTTDDMQRGQALRGGGALSTVLRGGIVAEQKLNLHTITHALNLFWGLEGRYPKDHDEFMEKIIKANGIPLEPLQEPYEYWYNPDDHQLYKRVKAEAIEAAKAEAEAKEAAAQ